MKTNQVIEIPKDPIKEFEKKQYLFSLLLLAILIGTAVVLNSLHLQKLAEDNTKFLTRMIGVGDFREVTLVLQQARISSFSQIQYKSQYSEKSFTLPAKAEYQKSNGLEKIYLEHITLPINTLASTNHDQIIYQYNRFRLVPYAFLIWIILNLVSIPQTRLMKKRLTEQFEKNLNLERLSAKSELAHEVRHNLRTPLAALQRIPQKLPDEVKQDRELLKTTIQQIEDLIQKLDDRPKLLPEGKANTEIYDTLQSAKAQLASVIPENIRFKFQIDEQLLSAQINHAPFELRAILGNLLNNSIEAIATNSGTVQIQAIDSGSCFELNVVDSGKGIPKDIIKKVFDKTFSYAKPTGTGVGLHHAKDQIEKWGGTISIDSLPQLGTTIKIQLPIKDREKWYLPRLKIASRNHIFVLDDQKVMHQFWKLKLKDVVKSDQLHCFNNPEEMISAVQSFKPQDCIFLCDYDLGVDSHQNGLEVLNQLSEQSLRCLVTGHFDDKPIRKACIDSNFYLFPKQGLERLVIV